MVVLTTSETTTTGVLAVLTDTTVTSGDVAAVLASLGEVSRHVYRSYTKEIKRRNVSDPISSVLSPSHPSQSAPRFRQTCRVSAYRHQGVRLGAYWDGQETGNLP